MIEYHLLPIVRQSVAWLACAARYLLVACAALAGAELLLLLLHQPLCGIACGLASAFLLLLCIALVVLLAMWSHAVLLAEQGAFFSRWLLRLCAILAPVAPLSWGYTMVTGKLLLYRQAELPLILCVVLLLAALLNIPNMAAANWKLQVRVAVLPLLLLVVLGFDTPGFIIIALVAKGLAAWVGGRLLRELQSVAPRIISMPEKE